MNDRGGIFYLITQRKTGNFLEACLLYEEAIAFGRQIRSTNMLTYPLRRLGYVALYEKNYSEAAQLFRESLEFNRQLGHLQGMTACLAAFAAIQRMTGNLEAATILCGCVEKLMQQISAALFFIDTLEYDRSVSELKKVFDEKAHSAAWSRGRTKTLERAIAFALEKTK